MSTQSSGHAPVPFSITTPLRNVRLMEVSDELLEIINNGSEGAILKFKSAATTGSGPQKDGVVHLCSDDRAWAVRQVSTSNSVYVMQPVTDDGAGDRDVDMDIAGTVAKSGMTATSQVGSFLELNSVPLDEGRVEREVVELVPIYHPESDQEQDLELLARNGAKAARAWARVVEDVAAPDRVVDGVGGKLCVFELESTEGVRCYVPSTAALLAVWSKIVEGCAIEGVKLDAEVSVVRVVNVLYDEVQSKVAERMFEVDGLLDSLALYVEGGSRKLKPVETSRFVAAMLLSSTARGQNGTRSMGLEDFLAMWMDLVPASYLKHCTVENLTSSTSTVFEAGQSEDGKQVIRWKGAGSTESYVLASALAEALVGGDQVKELETAIKSTSTSAAADKKRKWHEKFGAQRNAKR